MPAIPPPYAHQQQSTNFQLANDIVFDMSDPGTGKTRAALDAFAAKRASGGGKLLVLAPKSILQPAWGNDIEQFTPHLRYVTAYAHNRAEAFAANADIYITNHDAVKWLAEQPKSLLNGFDRLVLDEITAYKHRTSLRSKAVRALAKRFKERVGLSGTPNSNTITDLWHQMLILDGGDRLGKSFWKFRAATCTPTQVGPAANMVQWRDKPDIEDVVAMLIADIAIRNKFEDCISIPPNVHREINFALSPKHLATYKKFERDAMIDLETGRVQALNAAHVKQKLLQIASGAVYDGDRLVHTIGTDRYELVMQLVEERSQSVVAFNWSHQRDAMIALAEKKGIPYGLIDGTVTNINQRNAVVADFQAGKLRVIFAHPQSAGHGLTLTKGVATIWSSPTHNAEHFKQFNQRIYRNGQTEPTETLLVHADETVDAGVNAQTSGKTDRMTTFLDVVQASQEIAA